VPQELKEPGMMVAREDELLTLAHSKGLGLWGDGGGGQCTSRGQDYGAPRTVYGSPHGRIRSSDSPMAAIDPAMRELGREEMPQPCQ
jgi:hypothetical protein